MRTRQVQLLGARRVSGRAGVKLTPPHPHPSSNGLLGPHLYMGSKAKSSHCRKTDSLGMEKRAFELQWVQNT